MQALMELVAASFARHGIDSKPPAATATGEGDRPTSTRETARDTAFATALPQHDYRQIAQGDPSP